MSHGPLQYFPSTAVRGEGGELAHIASHMCSMQAAYCKYHVMYAHVTPIYIPTILLHVHIYSVRISRASAWVILRVYISHAPQVTLYTCCSEGGDECHVSLMLLM